MAYKEVSRVDIVEVIRRWQRGNSQRHIASGTGLSRETVRKYVDAALEAGVCLSGPAPTEEQVSRLAAGGRSGPRAVATPAEDKLVPWGRPDIPVAHRRPLAVDPHPGVVGGTGLLGFLHVAAALHPTAQLAESESHDGSDGAECAGGSGGAGLRTPGLHRGPRDRPPHGVGADRGAGLFPALFRVAHLQPEAGRRRRRTGGGLGFLRRYSPLSRHRQLPRRGRGRRRSASPANPGFPGVFTAPRLHRRSGPRASPQGQAQGGAKRPIRAGALLQGRRLQQLLPPEGGSGTLVS